MVSILSSLKIAGGARAVDAEPFRLPPRSTAPLDFPKSRRPERSNADLARMIEGEIIPRLMLAHAPARRALATPPAGSVGPRTLEAFLRMTLSSEAHVLTNYVETLIEGGLSLEEVYVDLLIPTARGLGDGWNDDSISFADVTIGLSRLQQLVRALGHDASTPEAGGWDRSAYFVPTPNEQHAFGLFIVEDCFRRAGWRTRLDFAESRDDPARTVHTDWFDVFGLSATSDTPVERISSVIAQVRQASCNRDLFVMVGGRLFIDDPDLSRVVGADATAETAAKALSVAENAVKPRALA